jgi:UDP-3-O-[3-hydroxymyristoyl] glucosamine N-acyltransferase
MLRWLRRTGPAPTLGDLVEALGGRSVACPASLPIESLGPVASTELVSLAPLWHERSVAEVASSSARILLADAGFAARVADAAAGRGTGIWIHPRPRRALRGVLELLYESADPWAELAPGTSIHPRASVHPSVRLGPGAVIGPERSSVQAPSSVREPSWRTTSASGRMSRSDRAPSSAPTASVSTPHTAS